ncbi:hypothetical protein MOQ_009024 [Trypanosoma cruzi marinkellei]|uniref:Uncharacterized protein n=1 Tax=Trypanosoma cruzi marinkellei TaxID=85056 RepID=K2LX95_TRYCR|nr:hypothetical protein MOQ_009024 [Trypanosoma cruzi marinkellei]
MRGMWREQPNILHPRHTGCSFFLPGDATCGQPPQRRDGPPAVSPHDARDRLDPAACSLPDPNVRALLSRYRLENERLRDQLKAHAVQEALLEQRLQELSAKNTALHLHDFRKKENDAVVEMLKKQLEGRECEVRDLQLQVKEQAGRIAAFEEAITRPLHGTDETPLSLSSPSPSPAAAVSSSPPIPASSLRTHELLCQVLSSVGFLTRVFNAFKHCQTLPHEGLGCPRSRKECTVRCLQAAMRGNQETVGDMMGRGHGVSCEALALAVREEVMFCELSAVQIAAQLLAAEHAPAAVLAVEEPQKETPTLPLEDDHPAVETRAAAEEKEGRKKERKEGEKETEEEEEKRELCDAGSISTMERNVSTVLTAPRATRKPTARPTVNDCEVQ